MSIDYISNENSGLKLFIHVDCYEKSMLGSQQC